jgi:excinuclease UvrABC helicase subunit UvrB
MGFFSYTKGIIIARGRSVRRSKTETKIYRDATISSATIARNNRRRKKMVIKKYYNNNNNTNMPTRLTMICPEEYHANRSAQEIWLFERGGRRLLESEDEDPYAQERNSWFARPEGSTSGLTANVENLYGLTKRVVARMFGQ